MKRLAAFALVLCVMFGVGLIGAAPVSAGTVMRWNVWTVVKAPDSHGHVKYIDAVIFHDNDPYTPDFAAAKCNSFSGRNANYCRYLNVTAVFVLTSNDGRFQVGPFNAKVFSGQISKSGLPKTTTTISPVTSPPGWQATVFGISVDACWYDDPSDRGSCAIDMQGSLWG